MDDNNRIPPENEQHVVPVDLVNAPPRYDEHYLDRLYENVSRENYDTPLPSGSNTPMLLSRNNSVDGLSTLASNLTALDMADSMGLTEATNRTWQQASVGSTPAATPSGSAPPSTHGVHLPSHTATSEDGYSRTSTPPSPPLKNLSRVPSYSTAVRTGTRNLEDANTLPLYDEGEMYIRSAPVSPQNSPPTSGGFMGRGRNNTASSINAFGRHSGTHGFRRGGAEGDGSIASNLNLGQPSNTGGLSIGQRSHSSHHLPSLSDLLGGLRG